MTGWTSNPSRIAASDRTLADLDFSSALDIVAGHAVSRAGKERIRSRRPSSDRIWVAEELADVAEMVAVIESGDRLRPIALPDVEDALDELEIPGSVPDGPALAGVGRCLLAIAEMGRDVERLSKDWARISKLQCELPPPALAERFARSFEPDGSLTDKASPQLARARRSVRTARSVLVRFLETFLRDRSEDVPAEAGITVRNGRYVVPVRREGRRRVQGLVHGESGSGATVFVEPNEAVDLGNDLSGAEFAEMRATQQVLRELAEVARDALPRIRDGWELCVALDDRYARARYARECDSAVPALVDGEGPLRISGGRHPLLLADLPHVVPFDIETDDQTRVIVVSGPNTGGKSVFLKALGLINAMAQAGVVPPVRKGTRVPVFDRIFSDIGDRQSISESLSTFSGHLQALKSILEGASARSMVLLDEFGTGTDPNEGAALAGAVLQALCERGSLTIATTHLGKLKDLAVTTPGAANASLQFDPEQLEPTYRFSLGIPGRSYGLAIAEGLGFPADVLDAARALQSDGERSLDDLLADLEVREHELQEREANLAGLAERLHSERDGLETLRAGLGEEQRDLLDRRRALEVTGREEARRYLLDARRRVEQALDLAQKAGSETAMKDARGVVEEGVRAEADALKGLEDLAAKAGWTVRTGKGRVIKPKSEPPVAGGGVKRRRPAPADSVTAARTEIDLRGMTSDEAEDAVLRAVDGAVVADLGLLRIIHGKGTGALRQRVTEILKRDRRVAAFRTGAPDEGSWGVTVAEFK